MAVRSRPSNRGQSTSTPAVFNAATPSSSRLTSSSVSSTISSGTRSSSSRSRTGHASAAARSAMVAWVRARLPSRAPHGCRSTAARGRRGGAGSARRGPAAPGVQRRRSAPPRRPRPAARSSPAAGRSRGSCRWCRDSRAWSRCSKVGWCSRRGASTAAADGADRGIASAMASSRPRTTASSSVPTCASIAIRSSSSASRPATRQLGGLPAGANFPAATSRMASSAAPESSPTGGVQVLAEPGLGQHRQRRPDRQADRASFIGELDDAVAGRFSRAGKSPDR